jgi:GAF domain-containing protein
LVDSRRLWFTASAGLSMTDTASVVALCDHTARQGGILLVEDAMNDPRFPSIGSSAGEEHIRFYAGAPLVTTDGQTVGAVCVFDLRPRCASPYQQAMLLTLADQVARQVELRAATATRPTARSAASRRCAGARRRTRRRRTGFIGRT